MKCVKPGEIGHLSCQALINAFGESIYQNSLVRAFQRSLASSASRSVVLLVMVSCRSASVVLGAVAQGLCALIKLVRQLRIPRNFHCGGSAPVSVLDSYSNVLLSSIGALSNNKGFKYVRKLTGSPLCGSRLSRRYRSKHEESSS